MPVSKAQQRAVSRYMKENYDVYQIRMPKGQKDIIKAHAEAQGESVNAFIGRAITETMQHDNAPQRPQEAIAVQGNTQAPQEAQSTASKATEGVPLHTLEQRVRRTLYKHGGIIKKDRKTGSYTIMYEDKSHSLPDFEALLDYAQALANCDKP